LIDAPQIADLLIRSFIRYCYTRGFIPALYLRKLYQLQHRGELASGSVTAWSISGALQAFLPAFDCSEACKMAPEGSENIPKISENVKQKESRLI